VDGREKADIHREHPGLTAQLLALWERFDRALLPYPPPRGQHAPAHGRAHATAEPAGWAD